MYLFKLLQGKSCHVMCIIWKKSYFSKIYKRFITLFVGLKGKLSKSKKYGGLIVSRKIPQRYNLPVSASHQLIKIFFAVRDITHDSNFISLGILLFKNTIKLSTNHFVHFLDQIYKPFFFATDVKSQISLKSQTRKFISVNISQ